ncbi:hypothetical protein AGMMS49992_11200 [Clostridia bacterium]|nr:hypothetical protein AGMMS49992_11200 [Clostridia bacterium]
MGKFGRDFLTCVAVVAVLLVAVGANREPAAVTASRVALESAIEDGSMIRLHVIANSDSDADQALKLRVRDAVLAAFAERLAASSPEMARETILSNLPAIKSVAESTLAQYDDADIIRPIEVTFAKEHFPEREYAGMVVPDGTYDSLVIRIGEAVGRNWWCVIYPALCLLTPDTVAAAEAARPVPLDAAAVTAISSPVRPVPTDVVGLIGVNYVGSYSLPRAAMLSKPQAQAAQPVFQSVILRWCLALISK